MARRRRNRKGRFVKRAGGRRRRAKRNPPMIGMNPRRRRRSGTRRLSYRRRRARRNPPAIARQVSGLLPPMQSVLAGALGAAGTRVIPGYASRFYPALPSSGWAGYGVKLAAAVAAGFAGRMVMGKRFGDDVTLGGFIVTLDQALRDNVYPMIGLPLGAFLNRDHTMGAYLQPGLSQYLSPGAVLPSISDYDMDDDAELGGIDVPARLDVNSRL